MKKSFHLLCFASPTWKAIIIIYILLEFGAFKAVCMALGRVSDDIE